jgi:hypothetical protein
MVVGWFDGRNPHDDPGDSRDMDMGRVYSNSRHTADQPDHRYMVLGGVELTSCDSRDKCHIR